MIQTVTGRIHPEAMGFCQPHEHLYVDDTPAALRNPALRMDDAALSTLEVKDYRAAGGDTLIDCQPTGAGRNLEALRHISAQTGVRIIAVTGYHMPVFYPASHWIFHDSKAALAERFMQELMSGVKSEEPGTPPVFPGAVKAAIGADGPIGRFETCLRAAASAAAGAQVPLILHTEAGAGAVEAVCLCESEGLDPAHIAVCHADRQAMDYSIHEAIARTGVFLEYDTIARPKYHDNTSEIDLIRHMLSRGYGDRLLMSLDTTSARLKSYGGAPGLEYILRGFIPMLRGVGVAESEIKRLNRDNPRRLFE